MCALGVHCICCWMCPLGCASHIFLLKLELTHVRAAECHFNDFVYFVCICNHLSNMKVSECWFRQKKEDKWLHSYQEELVLALSSAVKSSALWEFNWKGQRCCWYESLNGSVIALCDVNVSYCSDLRFTFIQIGWFVSEFGLCAL